MWASIRPFMDIVVSLSLSPSNKSNCLNGWQWRWRQAASMHACALDWLQRKKERKRERTKTNNHHSWVYVPIKIYISWRNRRWLASYLARSHAWFVLSRVCVWRQKRYCRSICGNEDDDDGEDDETRMKKWIASLESHAYFVSRTEGAEYRPT